MIFQSKEKQYAEDFELWAKECVKITDKLTGLPVSFILNRPQRRVLALLEEMRKKQLPIRLILLKARQWGGSTLIQVYMAWMQLVRRKGWNSIICAHVRDASAQIRGMYSRLLREYPDALKTGQHRDWSFLPFERSQSVSWIPARETQVAVATSLSPNSVRGANFAMAHLSEVAFWGDGDDRVASEIVRTVCGSVTREPDTLIVMESTANGTDNYFHREWIRATQGLSDKTPIFVPWHEIDLYRRSVPDSQRQAIIASLDDYELNLLNQGVELQRVAWYHDKRREYPSHEAMMAEFPSTPQEAFANPACRPLLHNNHIPHLSPHPTSGSNPSSPRSFLLLSPDGRPAFLSIFDFTQNISNIADIPLEDLSLPKAITRAVSVSRQHNARLTIAQTAQTGQPSNLRWAIEFAEKLHAPLARDEYENAHILLDQNTISHAADCFAALVEENKIIESSPEAIRQLKSCSVENPRRSPLALTRLLAATRFSNHNPIPVALSDFLP